jgi:hypothetical protein
MVLGLLDPDESAFMSLVSALSLVNDGKHGVFPSPVRVGFVLRVNVYGKPWRKDCESAFIIIGRSARSLLQQETS